MLSRRDLVAGAGLLAGTALLPSMARANANRAIQPDDTYEAQEVIDAGHRAFGGVTQGLAGAVERLFSDLGRPNAYVIGEEGGGALIAGVRYGEGMLVTRNAGQHQVFWQGPSIGFDFCANGSRTMMLAYNLQSVDDVYRRFGGINGSAYAIAGLDVSIYASENIYLAPIRTGVGARLGINAGYLNMTRQPTWNPF